MSTPSTALDRVVRKVPPTIGDKEEFRDQLIWQAALELARDGHDVVFVSSDGGFFESGRLDAGLATDLHGDVRDVTVRVVRSLEHCHELVAEAAPPIDQEALLVAILDATASALADAAGKGGRQPGDVLRNELKIYATENPDLVSVVFNFEQEAVGEAGERIDPVVYMRGTAFFDPREGRVSDCRPDEYGLRWQTAEGEERSGVVVLGAASFVIGVRERPWEARRQLTP